MKLNCKPGDLAILVRSLAGNEGKIVRCIRLLEDDGWTDGTREWCEPKWEVDQPLRDMMGGQDCLCPDSLLRPIRDPGEDARDETLEWLPVPRKELA